MPGWVCGLVQPAGRSGLARWESLWATCRPCGPALSWRSASLACWSMGSAWSYTATPCADASSRRCPPDFRPLVRWSCLQSSVVLMANLFDAYVRPGLWPLSLCFACPPPRSIIHRGLS